MKTFPLITSAAGGNADQPVRAGPQGGGENGGAGRSRQGRSERGG
ncbi:UNVERIFIED_CONTAM: hypothetical protein Q9R58_04290 [Methylobacteriaceae bacterium AG10]|nr:hypothetical protein [Methylobacteriaceae bacterium AG10]